MMKFCSTCGEAMIKAEVHDPEGVIPLSMQIDGAELWVCIRCGGRAEEGGLLEPNDRAWKI